MKPKMLRLVLQQFDCILLQLGQMKYWTYQIEETNLLLLNMLRKLIFLLLIFG